MVVHFAAATPIESPASNIDEPMSPLETSHGVAILEEQLEKLATTLPHSSSAHTALCHTSSGPMTLLKPSIGSTLYQNVVTLQM